MCCRGLLPSQSLALTPAPSFGSAPPRNAEEDFVLTRNQLADEQTTNIKSELSTTSPKPPHTEERQSSAL